MDTVVSAMKALFTMTTNKAPRFESQGGTSRESLALQNIQVSLALEVSHTRRKANVDRLDCVWSWHTCLLSSCPGCEGRLVVCSFWVVQMSMRACGDTIRNTSKLPACRGWESSPDSHSCSAADVNPIGGISKTDLKKFIAYAQTEFDLPILGR
jgi:NAD+ synthase (glutamine-hydrolysing)